MTDNEIIKALECCSKGVTHIVCKGCPFDKTDNCENLEKYALDLINRQQAENNTLKYQVNRLKKYDERRDIALHSRLIVNAKAEARKEFAEKVKANKNKLFNYIFSSRGFDEQIDNLVKESEEA